MRNAWGTVCNNGWTSTDSRVVCRQLGFSVAGNNTNLATQFLVMFGLFWFILIIGSIAFTSSSTFGQGAGLIVLNSVHCNGSESRLIECPSSNAVACSHNQDVGVRCQTHEGNNKP